MLAQQTGFIIYALHKSASMFLWQFYAAVAQMAGIPHFSRNNDPNNEDDLTPDIQNSFCFGPARTFELMEPRLTHVRRFEHILQVRDPRDILVSQYFSFGFSHGEAGWDRGKKRERDWIQKAGIDEYVVQRAQKKDKGGRPALKGRFKPLLALLKDRPANVTALRYEEMVLDYRSWIGKAIAPFHLDGEDAAIQTLWEQYHTQFEVTGERQGHRRKVIPGDHIEKLKPETIARLNEIFAEELATLGYQ